MKKVVLLSMLWLVVAGVVRAQQGGQSVPRICGAMKNVMRKGELYATIALDTIKDKEHLYGMGPLAYLKGEITVVDGKAYRAVVAADGGMVVTEAEGLTAPFFGYANVAKWRNVPLPDSVLSLPQLEAYLLHGAGAGQGPYFFRLTAEVATANVHIVNLPAGRKVSSPEEAHEGQKNYTIKNREVELIGFFSTTHQTIFTKHDTYLHVHLMTKDRTQMGHLEDLLLKAGTAKLYLPE